MSTLAKLKISTNLFLGAAEIKRLALWWKQNNRIILSGVNKYGIVRTYGPSGASTGFRVTEGSTPAKVTIAAGTAIAYDSGDDELRVIHFPSAVVDAADITADSSDYYVKLVRLESPIEVGTCQVSASGQLTGSGTLFTEVLRGQPSFPSKIAFEKTGLVNTGEYEVVTVTNDTSAQLSGSFTLETDLTYKVVGTFTPDVVVASGDKFIFEYNSYQIVVEASSTVNNTDEFLLAKVNTDGVTMVVEDMRTDWFMDGALAHLSLWGGSSANSVIGVEWAKYGSQYSDRSFNKVKIGWGIKVSASAWSIDPATNTITCTAGSGGIHDSLSTISNSDLNGWRIYFGSTSNYLKIRTQTTVAGTIVCVLDSYDHGSFPSSGTGALTIVPDCDKIAIRTYKKTLIADTLVEDVKFFPIHYGEGLIDIQVIGAIIKYQQYWAGNASEERLINDGDYINETSWDDDGVLVSAATSPVGSGEISLLLNPTAYSVVGMNTNVQNGMDAGGSIAHFYTTAGITSGVLQLPAGGASNLVSCTAASTTITGIANYGTGLVLVVSFTNSQTLTEGTNFDLGLYTGASLNIEANSTLIFYQSTSTPKWVLASRSGVGLHKDWLLSLNNRSATSDKLNVLLANDSGSARVYSLFGDSSVSPNSSTIYFPQGSGMMVRWHDPSTATEAWNSYTVVTGDLSTATGTASVTAGGAIKWKKFGKTVMVKLDITITLTNASEWIVIGSINPMSIIATNSNNSDVVSAEISSVLYPVLAKCVNTSTFDIQFNRFDGNDFAIGTNILRGTCVFETSN